MNACVGACLRACVGGSHPPIGTIGLTEPDARAKFGDENVTVKSARFGSMTYWANDEPGKARSDRTSNPLQTVS